MLRKVLSLILVYAVFYMQADAKAVATKATRKNTTVKSSKKVSTNRKIGTNQRKTTNITTDSSKVVQNKTLNNQTTKTYNNIVETDKDNKSFMSKIGDQAKISWQKFDDFLEKTNHYDEVKSKVGLFELKPDIRLGVGVGTYTNFQIGAGFTSVYNFNDKYAGFVGVGLQYIYQPEINKQLLKNKLLEDKNLFSNMEFRQQMDFMFRVGTRIKIVKDFFISPYGIIGGSFGKLTNTKKVYNAEQYKASDIYRRNDTIYKVYQTSKYIYNDLTDAQKSEIVEQTKNWDTINANVYRSIEVLKKILGEEYINSIQQLKEDIENGNIKNLSIIDYAVNGGEYNLVADTGTMQEITQQLESYEVYSSAEINTYYDAVNNGRVIDKRIEAVKQSNSTKEVSSTYEYGSRVLESVGNELSELSINTDAPKISIEQSKKLFLKGGLGLEFDFKNRFFLRLEYKYMRPKTTITNEYNVNIYQVDRTDVYTGIDSTNNITTRTYSSIYTYAGNYNKLPDSISGVSAPTVNVRYDNPSVDNTTENTSAIYTYDHSEYSNQKLIGQRTDTITKQSHMNIHEFSIGIGYYFL